MYKLVQWPECQYLFDLPGFKDNAYLANSDNAVDDFGSSAYFVDICWLLKQSPFSYSSSIEINHEFYKCEVERLYSVVKNCKKLKDISPLSSMIWADDEKINFPTLYIMDEPKYGPSPVPVLIHRIEASKITKNTTSVIIFGYVMNKNPKKRLMIPVCISLSAFLPGQLNKLSDFIENL